MSDGRRMSDQLRADHDLLIEIKTKLDGVLNLIAIKADAQAVVTLGAEVKDHEARMRELERRVVLALGALLMVQIAVGLYVAFWK